MAINKAGLFAAFFTAICGVTTLSTELSAATCTGNCGVGGPGVDGNVTASPDGGSYNWISTDGGTNGAGQISGVGGTDGSLFTSTQFSATAGDTLEFFFNYVTSDGSGFADYGWAELVDDALNHVAWLFTGRTQPNGDIAPGFGLPGIDATLDPLGSPIIDGESNWSPLGGDSGLCFQGVGQGCGQTGWIKSTYDIAADGNYFLLFGVTNWSDTAFDSGLAFDGAKIDGKPIDPPEVPLPGAALLLLTGLAGVAPLGPL